MCGWIEMDIEYCIVYVIQYVVCPAVTHCNIVLVILFRSQSRSPSKRERHREERERERYRGSNHRLGNSPGLGRKRSRSRSRYTHNLKYYEINIISSMLSAPVKINRIVAFRHQFGNLLLLKMLPFKFRAPRACSDITA